MVVANACQSILEEHIANPWRWPRESDLVASLVNKIHGSLEKIGYAYAKPNLSVAALDCAGLPRVRTEVKIPGKKWKIDVCLQAEGRNNIACGRGGIRDVLLEVDPSQIEEIVEVKLNPGRLYTDWVDDLVKLYKIRAQICDLDERKLGALHGLFVDTSLPLGSLRPSTQPKRPLRKAKRIPRVWPLGTVDGPDDFDYKIGNEKWKIKLTEKPSVKNTPSSHGEPAIYLWAIVVGEKEGDVARAKVACWRVEISKLEPSDAQ